MGVSRLANRILLCVLLGALLSACGDGNGSVLNGEGTPTVTRVSEDRLDNDANGASSHPSISGDGLMVAFQSDATDLVASDSNGVTDVFLRNTQTDATTRISLDNGNLQTNGASRDPSASSNGRYIAFESDATDIDISDNNGLTDIYLRDTQSGTTWVSVDAGGFQANGASRNPSVSSNGRYVAFESDATDINNNDNNGLTDIYLRDTQANTTAWVSVDSGGAQANGASRNPAVSGNGLFVAFESDATDINNNDNNGLTDIYLRDTQANTTAWVSVDANGLQADGASRNPSVSGDGRYVAFESDATDIDAGDDNGLTDIYLRDTQANTTAWISMNSQGFAANGASTRPAISGDGLWVVFVSLATDLVSTDTNGGVADIFLHDVMGGTTTRLSDGPLSSPLDEADGSSDRPVLSTDGSAVAFESLATNLVTGDGNGVSDIFFDTLP